MTNKSGTERYRHAQVGWLMIVVGVMAWAETSAWGEFPKEVTITGRTIECRTAEEIRAIGLECEEMPWQENAARVYIEAMNAYVPASMEMQKKGDAGVKQLDFGEDTKAIAEHLADNKHALELVKQANRMQRSVFPVHKTARITEMKILSLWPLWQLEREMMWRSVLQFQQGKQDEAVESWREAMRVAEMTAKPAMMLFVMLEIAEEKGAVEAMDRMVKSGKMNEETLKELGSAMKNVSRSSSQDFAKAVKAERAWHMAMVDDLLAGVDVLTAMGGVSRPEIDEVKWRTEFDANVTRKNLKAVYDFFDEEASKPAWEALKAENRFDAFWKKHEAEWDTTTQMIALRTDQPLVASFKVHAQMDGLELRIALERYKLAKKAYPKTLGELTPGYPKKTPTDPFSGKEYQYRTTDNGGFLLWSVGEDLEDNGGSDKDITFKN